MKLRRRHGLISFAVGFVLTFLACNTIPLDKGAAAAEANDPTIVFSGCGQGFVRGYLFCQIRHGAAPIEAMTLNFPPMKCKRESCVRYQILRKDGTPGPVVGGLPQGQTQLKFSVSDLIGGLPAVDDSAEGEYQVLARLYFTGPDGAEYQKDMIGFLRLNVLAEKYSPAGCNDPAAAWSVTLDKESGCSAQWTTNLRGAVCGKCLPHS